MRPISVLSAVIRTRNIILRYGWIQGGSGSIYTGFCIFSALREAIMMDRAVTALTAEDHALLRDSMAVLDEAAGRRCPMPETVWFNDNYLTSKQEALEFLNEVIAEQRVLINAA